MAICISEEHLFKNIIFVLSGGMTVSTGGAQIAGGMVVAGGVVATSGGVFISDGVIVTVFPMLSSFYTYFSVQPYLLLSLLNTMTSITNPESD